MAPSSNFLADLTQMANGAASAFGGVREEVDKLIRQRMERSLNARGLVTREDFDALRTRHEALAARIALLEVYKPTCYRVAGQNNLKSKTGVKTEGRVQKEQQIIELIIVAADQQKAKENTSSCAFQKMEAQNIVLI